MRRPLRAVVVVAMVLAVLVVLRMAAGVVTSVGLLSGGGSSSSPSAADQSSEPSSSGSSDSAEGDLYVDGHGFSYGCLTSSQQAVYDQLFDGVSGLEASFTIDCDSTDDIEPALRALLEDHPELFWLDGAATYQRSGLLGRTVTVTPATNVSLDEVEGIRETIDSEVSSWLESLPTDASDYDKVRSAYEWVINNTDYDLTSDQNQNIQSVFVGHRSVCAGYAKAFQYLLHRAGVWCAYVTGQIEAGQHAWDLVCIDGTYTYCDPTWGDPTYFTSQGESQEGNISYDYLCLTTEEMERDNHVADRADQLPICDSDAYDWYRLHGTYLTSVDSEAIADGFWAAVDAGESEVGYKLADDATYQEVEALLSSNGFLQNSLTEYGRQRGLSQVDYSYATDAELRVVHVFW